jgi:N-acetylglutamate synthase-like GNAT family acetyltransferase
MNEYSILSVRVATDADRAVAERIAQQAFDELRSIYRPKESALPVDSPRIVRLVAEAKDQIVGTVLYTTESDRLHLRALAVDSAYRCTGVASAIIEYLSELAKSAGLKSLSLYTVKQTGNVAIFDRLGFRSVSEEPASWAVSDRCIELTDVFMQKPV